MFKKLLGETDLLKNPDGSIYHLNLLPGELAETIILVGDPDRVEKISQQFDQIEIRKKKREFVTHTGMLKGKRFSVVSTGVGTDNIDIVINECDALHNIDFNNLCVKDTITTLRFLRLGTCGGVGKDIELGSLLLSSFGVAIDGLMSFYQYQPTEQETSLLHEMQHHFKLLPLFSNAYVAAGDASFSQQFARYCRQGITLTCAGFYGPQYRTLRSPLIENNILEIAAQFSSAQGKIINVEMETAGIYALSRLLGHQACSISVVLDNCTTDKVSKDIQKSIDEMISTIMSVL